MIRGIGQSIKQKDEVSPVFLNYAFSIYKFIISSGIRPLRLQHDVRLP